MKRKKRKLTPSAARQEEVGNSASPSALPKGLTGPRTPTRRHILVLLCLLALNLALYQRTLRTGFLSVDDGDYVQNNPHIGSLDSANLKFILTKPYFANYAPATLLSYAADVALARGRSAFAFHFSNVLWHAWVVCMVYFLAFTIRPRVVPAAAAALLFLLHPAHVEVVAWISSRKDLVATGFAALSMAAYLRHCRATVPTSAPLQVPRFTPWYIVSLLAFLLAAAAKQSVLLLPAAFLAWDLLVERRRDWKTFLDKTPYVLVAAFFGWMTWRAQPATGQSLRPFVLAMTQFADLCLLTGLGKYVLYRPAPDPAAWAPAVRLLLVIAAAAVWAVPLFLLRFAKPAVTPSVPPETKRSANTASTSPMARLCVLCYWTLISLIPPMLLNFIVPVTDRYLFLSSVTFCILLVEATALWATKPRVDAGRFWRPFAWLGLACLAALWTMKTSSYIAEWQDPRSVWYGAHLKTKDPQVAQFLGQWYQDNGERIDDFIRSGAPSDVTNQLGLAAAVLEDPARVAALRAEWLGNSPSRTNSIAFRDRLWDFAWNQFEAAVARRGMLSTPNLFMCRGRLLVREGKYAQAIPEFNAALRLAETSHFAQTRFEGTTHALYAIGVAHWNMGRYRDAQQWLLKAQAVQKQSRVAWIGDLDLQVERVSALAASPP